MLSRIRHFVTGTAGFVTGVVGLVTGIAFLVDFMESRTNLVEIWPTVGALLPVVALGVTTGGVVLVLGSAAGSAWRWFAPRRPSERFRQLAPAIRQIVLVRRGPPMLEPARLRAITDHAQVAADLRALGVVLPEGINELTILLILAEQGQLDEARKAFSLASRPPPQIGRF